MQETQRRARPARRAGRLLSCLVTASPVAMRHARRVGASSGEAQHTARGVGFAWNARPRRVAHRAWSAPSHGSGTHAAMFAGCSRSSPGASGWPFDSGNHPGRAGTAIVARPPAAGRPPMQGGRRRTAASPPPRVTSPAPSSAGMAFPPTSRTAPAYSDQRPSDTCRRSPVRHPRPSRARRS